MTMATAFAVSVRGKVKLPGSRNSFRPSCSRSRPACSNFVSRMRPGNTARDAHASSAWLRNIPPRGTVGADMDEKKQPTAVEHEHEHHAHDHHEMQGHDHGGHDHHEMQGHDHGAHDHSGHAGHDPAIFRRKFWLTLVLTIPTLVFSQGLQEILGLGGPRFPGSQFIPAVFGVVIFFYGGLVFLRGAVDELKAKQPGMMTLISLAIVVAFGYSVAVTLGLPGMDFWWELATLILIMLLGHWIEMSAVMGAQDALGELAKLLPDTAERVGDVHAEPEHVAVSDLRVGDLVRVRPGGAVPADGEIVDGRSEVDESLLTGESKPVARGAGEQVVAGSISGSGSLRVPGGRTRGEHAPARSL